jgi:hypothetical protein
MRTNRKTPVPNSPAAPDFKPQVTFKPTLIPQGNGRYLVEPGKPVVVQSTDEISAREFAKAVGLSHRHVNTLCDEGQIVCRRKSPKAKSEYLIPRSEVDRYRNLGQ